MSRMSGCTYKCAESHDGSHYVSLTGVLYESQWCPEGLRCVSHELVFLTQIKQAQVSSLLSAESKIWFAFMFRLRIKVRIRSVTDR